MVRSASRRIRQREAHKPNRQTLATVQNKSMLQAAVPVAVPEVLSLDSLLHTLATPRPAFPAAVEATPRVSRLPPGHVSKGLATVASARYAAVAAATPQRVVAAAAAADMRKRRAAMLAAAIAQHAAATAAEAAAEVSEQRSAQRAAAMAAAAAAHANSVATAAGERCEQVGSDPREHFYARSFFSSLCKWCDQGRAEHRPAAHMPSPGVQLSCPPSSGAAVLVRMGVEQVVRACPPRCLAAADDNDSKGRRPLTHPPTH